MAQVNLTIAQIKDLLGDPIVFLQAFDRSTGKLVTLTDRDIPAQFRDNVVAWINARLSTP